MRKAVLAPAGFALVTIVIYGIISLGSKFINTGIAEKGLRALVIALMCSALVQFANRAKKA